MRSIICCLSVKCHTQEYWESIPCYKLSNFFLINDVNLAFCQITLHNKRPSSTAQSLWFQGVWKHNVHQAGRCLIWWCKHGIFGGVTSHLSNYFYLVALWLILVILTKECRSTIFHVNPVRDSHLRHGYSTRTQAITTTHPLLLPINLVT